MIAKALKIAAADIAGIFWNSNKKSLTFMSKALLGYSAIISYYLWVIWFGLPIHRGFTAFVVLFTLPAWLYSTWCIGREVIRWVVSVKRRARAL